MNESGTLQLIIALRDNVSGAVDKIKASLMALANVAGAGFAVKEAMAFEAAMADVIKVVGGTDTQIAALSSNLKDMSMTSLPLAVNELAQIAAAGGQLGIPIENLQEFTELAAQMGVAFGMSAAEAGDAVAKMQNVFGLTLTQTRELSDAINTLGNNTAAREADIINVMVRVGGMAKQFGLAKEETAALADAFIALGAPPEIAATSINALLSKLQTAGVQSDKFQEGLAKLGYQADDLAQRIADKPQAALREFLASLERLEGKTKAETLTKLFGAEYQDDIARLVGGIQNYDKALGLINDKTKVLGATQKEFDARMKTTEAQWQLMVNAIKVAAINLGTIFLPAVKTTVVVLGKIIAGVAKIVEQFPMLSGGIAVLGSLALSFGALKIAVGAAISVVGDFGASILSIPGLPNILLSSMITAMGIMERFGSTLKIVGGIGAAAFIGWEIGTLINQIPNVAEGIQSLIGWLDKLRGKNDEITAEDRKTWAEKRKFLEEWQKQHREAKEAEMAAEKAAQAVAARAAEIEAEVQKAHEKSVEARLKSLQSETTARKAAIDQQLANVEMAAAREIEASYIAEAKKREILNGSLAVMLGYQSAYVDDLGKFYVEQLEKAKNLESQRIDISLKGIESEMAAQRELMNELTWMYAERAVKAEQNNELLTEEDEKRVKDIEKINDQIMQLEVQLAQGRAEKAKVLAQFKADVEDAHYQSAKEITEKIIALADEENRKRVESSNRALAEIALAEAEGVLTAQEAAVKKAEIAVQLAESRIAEANRVIAAVIIAEGLGTDNYKEAVAEKSAAETELINKKAEYIKAVNDAAQEVVDSAAEEIEALRGLRDQLELSNESVRILADAFNQPMVLRVDMGQAQESLADLNQQIGLVQENIQNSAGTLWGQQIFEQNHELLSQLEALKGQFDAASATAAQLGIKIDASAMSIEEYADAVLETVEAWSEAGEEIQAITNDLLALSDSFSDTGDGFADSAQSARDAFGEASEAVEGLIQKVEQMNSEFRAGNIESGQAIADAVVDTYDSVYQAAEKTLEQLKQDWEDYGEKVLEITGMIEDITAKSGEIIRDLKRETMTDMEVWQDQRLEYEETYAAAVAATTAGNIEQAEELFNNAMDIAKDLGREIKDENGTVIKDLGENTKIAIGLVEDTAGAAQENFGAIATEAKNMQAEVGDLIGGTVDKIQLLANKIGEAVAKALGGVKSTAQATAASAVESFNIFFGKLSAAEQQMMALKQTINGVRPRLNVDFTGSGSAVLPISEKIEAVEEMLKGFSGDVSGLLPEVEIKFAYQEALEDAGASIRDFISKINVEISSGLADKAAIRMRANGGGFLGSGGGDSRGDISAPQYQVKQNDLGTLTLQLGGRDYRVQVNRDTMREFETAIRRERQAGLG